MPLPGIQVDLDFPPGRHLVHLTGWPRTLAWPGICPNCGAPAPERVKVRKVFGRTFDRAFDREYHVIVIRSIVIPLCGVCAGEHRAALRAPSARQVVWRIVRSPAIIGIVAPLLFANWLGWRLFADDGPHGWVEYAVVGVCVLISIWTLLLMLWNTRSERVPPLTEVASACDFSDNMGTWPGHSHRVYAIRNAAFAQAFAEANRHRLWTATQAHQERRIKAAVVLLFVSIAVAAIVLPRIAR